MHNHVSTFETLGRKEGRKYYICSSRLGLIRWDIIQHVKAVHHKMSNTSDVQLPHELLHCASTIGKQCSILGQQSAKYSEHSRQSFMDPSISVSQVKGGSAGAHITLGPCNSTLLTQNQRASRKRSIKMYWSDLDRAGNIQQWNELQCTNSRRRVKNKATQNRAWQQQLRWPHQGASSFAQHERAGCILHHLDGALKVSGVVLVKDAVRPGHQVLDLIAQVLWQLQRKLDALLGQPAGTPFTVTHKPLEVLGALGDAPDDASTSSSSALAAG